MKSPIVVVVIILIVLYILAFISSRKPHAAVPTDTVEFESGRKTQKRKSKKKWIKTHFTTYTTEQTSTDSQYGMIWHPFLGNIPTVAVNCWNWDQFGGAVLELKNSAGKTTKVFVNDICGANDGGSCLTRSFNIDLSSQAAAALFHNGWWGSEEGSFRDLLPGTRYLTPFKWNKPYTYDACQGRFDQRRV